MAKAMNATAACRTREIIPPSKKRSSPKINSPSSTVLLRVPLRIPHSFRLRTTFLYRNEIVRGKIVQHVHIAARPTNFQGVHALVFSQPKKDAWILRRAIAHPAFHLVVTLEIPGGQFKIRSIPIAIAFRPNQPDREPVISRRCRLARAVVVKQLRVLAVIAYQKILPTVVVVIAHSKPAPHAR